MNAAASPSPRGRRRAGAVAVAGAALAALVVLALVVFHDAAANAAIGTFARGAGYDVRFGTLHVGTGAAGARDVRVTNRGGEPVFEAQRVDLAYSLRDLLPGGKRRFGLKSIDIAAPHLTLIRHADGTYNIPTGGPSAQPARPNTTPVDVRLRVRDGSVDIVDRYVAAPRERRDRISGVRADAVLSPVDRSYYDVAAVLEENGGRYPLRGRAKFEDARGFEIQHWTIARLPIAGLANFALPNRSIVVSDGDLRGLDARYAGLSGADGAMHFHLNVHATLEHARITLAALQKPIRDAHGPLIVYDDGASVPGLDGSLNGVPLHVAGGLYDFAHPQLHFALHAAGTFDQLRPVSKNIERMPLHGRLVLDGLAEGPASAPVTFVRFESRDVAFGAYAFTGAHGLAAISGQQLDVISAAARYGPVDLAAHASLLLERHVAMTAFGSFTAPANGVPYAGSLVPGMTLGGTAVINGVDAKLATRGAIRGVNGPDRLDAPFSIDADGRGTVGPVALQRRDGASVYARAYLDRPHDQTVAIVQTHALSLRRASRAALPGFAPPPLPPLDGKLDASLAGIAVRSTLASLGGSLHGYGSWGDVRADADGSARGIAATGHFTGSFERLAAFTGKIGARGGIDAPFAVTSDGRTTTAQLRNARFRGASIRGIAIESADATVGVRPKAIDVYAARLGIAHRTVAAQGSFGNGGRLLISAGDLDLRAFRAAGLPLQTGRATAIAVVGGTFAQPRARMRVALAGARYAGAAVDGDARLAYARNAVRIEDATVGLGGAYATAGGTISGLAPGKPAPRYDVRANVRDADIALLAHTMKAPLRYPAGTLDADVRIGGSGSVPTINGRMAIPEGSINGLAFEHGAMDVSGNAAHVRARDGRVTVGSTTLAFAGDVTPAAQSLRLHSDRVNLADFNDYFDEADVLAGRGRVALALDASRSALAASGNLALTGTRYRRFVLGNADAVIATSGHTVRTTADVAGPNGRVALRGSLQVPSSDPMRDIARRAYVDMSARIAGLDLGTVLPAAGVNAPVLGIVSGAATVRGRYPALALNGNAALANGVAGRIPIQRLTIALSATNGHGRITEASLVTSALTATGSGTFGLRPTDAVDLSAHIVSPDVNALALLATGKAPDVHGSLDSRVNVTGVAARPLVRSISDLDNVAYRNVVVPNVHAEIDATRDAVDVRRGNVALRRGAIAFGGHYPFGRGAQTPIAFDFAPRGVDVADYSSLLPAGTAVQGIIDGNLGVRGTLGAPQLSGGLALTRGSYRSDLLKSPLTAVTLQLAFAGTEMRIIKAHAHAAPGSIDGSGVVRVGDLRDPLRGVGANIALSAKNALIVSPKYYTGFVDAALTAVKNPYKRPLLAGAVTFSSARVPYAAFIPSGAAPSPNAPAPPDVGFNVALNIGKDVRVTQGPVDIGATGGATLGGTLARPTLDGTFTATDGTLAFYRTFTLQQGSDVSFTPADGIIPAVDAMATTHVPDPSTDVLLKVTGPATHLNLAFASQPQYSKEQILGLLVNAQALGAVSGVPQTALASTGGPSPIAGVTEGYINQEFTRQFLQPLDAKLGAALGLSNLQLSYGFGGSFSAIARRLIGHNIAFTYGETFGGQTPRSSLGLSIGGDATDVQLTFYNSANNSRAFGGQALTPYLQSGFLQNGPLNYTLQAAEPPAGTSGFVFTFQRRFP